MVAILPPLHRFILDIRKESSLLMMPLCLKKLGKVDVMTFQIENKYLSMTGWIITVLHQDSQQQTSEPPPACSSIQGYY